MFLGDETLPICQRCRKAGRYCDRSEKPLRFRNFRNGTPAGTKAPTERTVEFPSPENPRKALEAFQIARYFAHYIAELAPWYDLSDGSAKFGTEIPEKALHTPLLFSAIVAFGAMHVSCTTAPTARLAAEFYHDCCVRMLIAIEESDEQLQRGVALATTCLLRSYELLAEDVDPNRHLQGAYSLASYQNLLLRERQHSLLTAGFWNYLREDITFSLFEQCPLKMDLEAIPPPADSKSDHAYLNTISLILGRIVNAAFSSKPTDQGWLTRLKSVQAWRVTLPPTFEPFSRASDKSALAAIPTIRMIQDCHVSAMHYHLVALSILAQQLDFDTETLLLFQEETETQGLSVEDMLERFALDVCGSAFTSNSTPVLVNSFGPISYCARFIRHPASRSEVTRRLLATKRTTGWAIERIITELESYWQEAGTAEGSLKALQS